MTTILLAIERTHPADLTGIGSEEIAATITAPRVMRPMSLREAFVAAAQGGAVPDEIRALYQHALFVADLRDNLAAGDLGNISELFEVARTIGGLSQASVDGLAAVLAGRALSAVDLAAADLGVEAPESVTAADVDTALER